MEKKISFNDLNLSLKTLAVLCWIIAGIYLLSFLVGLIIGIIEIL